MNRSIYLQQDESVPLVIRLKLKITRENKNCTAMQQKLRW